MVLYPPAKSCCVSGLCCLIIGPLHSVLHLSSCSWTVGLFRSHPTRGSSSQMAPDGQDPRCFPTLTATRWCSCPAPAPPCWPRRGPGGWGDWRGKRLWATETSQDLFLAHASDVVGRWWAGPCSAIQTEKQGWQPYCSTKMHQLPDGLGGCANRG